MGFFRKEKPTEQAPRMDYRQQDPHVLTGDVILTFMDAADERSEQFSFDLLHQSVAAASRRGHGIRARGIVKDLRWLAKQAAKDGIYWEGTP